MTAGRNIVAAGRIVMPPPAQCHEALPYDRGPPCPLYAAVSRAMMRFGISEIHLPNQRRSVEL